MKKALTLLLCLSLSGVSEAAFSYYKQATLAASQAGSADSTNWPLTIGLDGNVQAVDTDLKTTGNGGFVTSSSGYDVRPYSDSALTTPLTFELVYYDAASGKLEMHVKIPTLSASVNTVIYLAFGDATVTTDGSSASTWDSNYLGVWHMKDGTTLSVTNSVTAGAGTNSGPTASGGEIDGGAVFAASTDIIASDLTIALPSNVTLEAWAYRTGSNTAPRIFSFGNFHTLRDWTATDIGWLVNFSGGQAQWSVAPPAAGSWHSVAVTHDATNAANDPLMYVNGSTQTLTSDLNTSGTLDGTAFTLKFGNRDDLGRPWLGSLDELRLSNSIRSPSWLLAGYNAQKSSSTFITWGARTAVGGAQPACSSPFCGVLQ